MRELIRSNDPVLLSYIDALLKEADIPHEMADVHISVMEGSIAAFPRRVLVDDEDFEEATRDHPHRDQPTRRSPMPDDLEAPHGRMETTEDAFLGGRLTIAQAVQARGPGSMRCFSRRPAPPNPATRVLDAGSRQRHRRAGHCARGPRACRQRHRDRRRALRIGPAQRRAQRPRRPRRLLLRRCQRAARAGFSRSGPGAGQLRPRRRQSALPGGRRGEAAARSAAEPRPRLRARRNGKLDQMPRCLRQAGRHASPSCTAPTRCPDC